MNRIQFIKALATELAQAQVRDTANTLDYYEELIDDRLEDGESELTIIASLESPRQIAARLSDERPIIRQRKTAPMTLALIIIVVVLGSPLWGSLLLTAILLIAVGYFLIWLVPALAAIFAISGIVGGGVSFFLAIIAGVRQGWLIGSMQFGLSIAMLGVGLLCAGLAWYSGCYLVKWSVGLTRWLLSKFKARDKEVA